MTTMNAKIRSWLPVVVAVTSISLPVAAAPAPAPDVDPSLEEPLRQAVLEFDTGDFEPAQQGFASLAPKWPTAYFNLGVAAEANGNLELSIRSYEAHLRRNADDPVAQAALRRVMTRRDAAKRRHRRLFAAGGVMSGLSIGFFAGGSVLITQGGGDEGPIFGGIVVALGVGSLTAGVLMLAIAGVERRRVRARSDLVLGIDRGGFALRF